MKDWQLAALWAFHQRVQDGDFYLDEQEFLREWYWSLN